jgi:hypothetical protein
MLPWPVLFFVGRRDAAQRKSQKRVGARQPSRYRIQVGQVSRCPASFGVVYTLLRE